MLESFVFSAVHPVDDAEGTGLNLFSYTQGQLQRSVAVFNKNSVPSTMASTSLPHH